MDECESKNLVAYRGATTATQQYQQYMLEHAPISSIFKSMEVGQLTEVEGPEDRCGPCYCCSGERCTSKAFVAGCCAHSSMYVQ